MLSTRSSLEALCRWEDQIKANARPFMADRLRGAMSAVTDLKRWVTAADHHDRSMRVDAAVEAGIGQAKYRDSLSAERTALDMANERRTWLWFCMAFYVAIVIILSVWVQHRSGEPFLSAAFLHVATVVLFSMAISTPRTGPKADIALGFVCLAGNLAWAYTQTPNVVLAGLGAPPVGLLVYGFVQGPGESALRRAVDALPQQITGGDKWENRLIAGLRFASPKIDRLIVEHRKALSAGEATEFPIAPFHTVTQPNGVEVAEVRLPGAATVTDIRDHSEQFAKGMELPENRVLLSDCGNPGLLRVSVFPVSPELMPAGDWPHLTQRAFTDNRLCVGFDEFDEPAFIGFGEGENQAVFGQKGSGKSNLQRLFVTGWVRQWAGRTRLHYHNFKGNADGLPFEQIAHTYSSGSSNAHIDLLMDNLLWLLAEQERMNSLMEAESRKDMGAFPEQRFDLEQLKRYGEYANKLVVDEADIPLNHTRHGPELKRLLLLLAEKGRSVQQTFLIGTQRAAGDRIPNDLLAQADTRVGLYLADHNETKAALGDGWGGPKPQTFRYVDGPLKGRPIPGIAAVRGASSQFVRVSRLDVADADTLISVEHQERQKAGMLSGMAVGDDPFPSLTGVDNTAVHVLEVWPTDDNEDPAAAVSSQMINELLTTEFERYSGMTTTATTQQLTRLGVQPGRVVCHYNPDGNKQRGFKYDDIKQASRSTRHLEVAS